MQRALYECVQNTREKNYMQICLNKITFHNINMEAPENVYAFF